MLNISQDIINKIIDRAQNLLFKEGIVLPYQKGCVLTGQAAVSLLLEEISLPEDFHYTKKSLTINDIDVFKLVHYDLNAHMIEKVSKPSLEFFSSRYGDWIGRDGKKHKVVSTIKHGIFNLTNIYFEYNVNNEEFAKELIQRFDVNSTQFAIDLDSRQAYWTKAFEHFIQTGMLEITDLKTPCHTAIRFVDKVFTHGYKANLYEELDKIAALGSNLSISRMFGEEMQKRFQKYSDVIEKIFTIEEIRFAENQKYQTFRLKVKDNYISQISKHLRKEVYLDDEIMIYSTIVKEVPEILENFNKISEIMKYNDNVDINTILKELHIKLYDIDNISLIDINEIISLKETIIEEFEFGKDLFYKLKNYNEAFRWNKYIKSSSYKKFLSKRLPPLINLSFYEIDTIIQQEFEIFKDINPIGESAKEPISKLKYSNLFVVELNYVIEENSIQMLCFDSSTKEWIEKSIVLDKENIDSFKSIEEVKILESGDVVDKTNGENIDLNDDIAF